MNRLADAVRDWFEHGVGLAGVLNALDETRLVGVVCEAVAALKALFLTSRAAVAMVGKKSARQVVVAK